ncbi:hypothetical protein D3C71_2201220 [compost metagenome]
MYAVAVHIIEENARVVGEPDKPSEGNGVEYREPPGIRMSEDAEVVFERFGRRGIRGIFS